MSSDSQRDASPSDPIQRVLILGAGWTGRQIAGQIAAHGASVVMLDSFPDALSVSLNWIRGQRASMIANGYWPDTTDNVETELMSRVSTVASLEQCSKEFDLVIESVSEQFSLKRRLLKECSARFPSPCTLVSNSSYFTPSMLQKHIDAPERFAHFHFHVPIWRATLVDIAAGQATSESTLERLTEFAHRIGQTPLVQRVENPGYVFNWMLRSLFQSSLQLVDRGVAEPADVDLAWRKVTGMELGPFAMMDQIGIDLVHQTMSHARFVDGDDLWERLIAIVQPYVDSNQLGVKTGQGFFDYRKPGPGPTSGS